MPKLARPLHLAALMAASWTLLAQSSLRFEEPAQPHRLLLAGQSTEIEVRLLDMDGAPAAGREILFVAPPRGARGSWTGHDGSRPWLSRDVTDADGRARRSWTASDSHGPYLLSVVADGYTAQLQFAVTNVEAMPSPTVTADNLRQEWTGKLALDGAASQLHGPFFLSPNTELWGNTRALQGEEFYFSSASPHWLLWVDDAPRARYGHPGRFVLVNANSGQSQVVAQKWWPLVWWPQAGAPAAVYPPFHQAADLLPDPPAQKQITVLRAPGAAERLGAKPERDAFAIVIHGVDENHLRRSSLKMVDFFRDDLKIPETHIYSNKNKDGDLAPATHSDIDRMVVQFCKAEGKKIFVYVSSHGGPGTFKLANESEEDGNSKEDSMTYSHLAERIRGCGESINAQFILDVGASGTAIRDIHTVGLDGAVFAGADLDGATLFNYWGGHFTDGLIDAWREKEADKGGDGVDLQEAFSHMVETGSENSLYGHPITSLLIAGADRIPVNNIGIDRISNTNQNPATITIQRPKGSIGAVSGSFSIRSPADGKTVAIVLGGDPPDRRAISFPDGVDEIQVTLRGVAEGTTTYLVELLDEQRKQYRGEATIRVGSGFTISPSNPVVNSGQTAALTLKRDLLTAKWDGAVNVRIMNWNAVSAEVAQFEANIAMSADELEKPFNIETSKPGVATFKVEPDGLPSREFLFSVLSSGLTVDPNKIEIAVGESRSVTLKRFGTSSSTAVTYATSPGGALIASLSPAEPFLGLDQNSLELQVLGRSPGTVTYTLADDKGGYKTELQITVKAAPALLCLTRGTFNAVFDVLKGQGHAPFFNLTAATLNFLASGTQASVNSNHPNLPPASGTYSSGCEFNATGRATIVGMPGITFEYFKVRIDRASGKIEGEFGAGLNNDLPGMYPIWYWFTGNIVLGTGQ